MENKEFYIVTDGELSVVGHDTYKEWVKQNTMDGVIATESIGDNKVVTTFNGEFQPVFYLKANDGPYSITYDFKSAMAAHEKECAEILKGLK